MFSNVTLHSPYFNFWNVEGGNKVYHKNNLGLPGCDVDTSSHAPNIIVLGDSYLEAESVPNDSVSTSYLSSYIASTQMDFNVINAGCATYDPYSLWFRLKFFEKIYPPSFVILVTESFFEGNLAQYKLPLSFDLNEKFGTRIKESVFSNIVNIIRTKSSFVNLVFRSLAQQYENEGHENKNHISKDKKRPELITESNENIPESYIECILKYHIDYGSKFILVGASNDVKTNSILDEFCEKNNINFICSNTLLQPENRFEGRGHLNIKGNKKLGDLLIEAYKKFIRK